MTDAPNEQPNPFDLNSDDVAARKRTDLKRLFPEVFNEDKIDLDQLRRVMGDWVDESTERFGLTWPGKAACMKVIQAPATGALRPDREESVNFDVSENVFIEGDNLEVLKLLQKAYFGRIKMIYIDPPYNTGNEFIYPDNYAENLDTYLAYTGQSDDDGRKFSTNSEGAGRFHSRWLNMMLPRLYLAKNLLREDGAIFVSINDAEAANLKAVLDTVFGQENFISQMVWQRSKKGDSKQIANIHEYIFCYTKNSPESIKNRVWRKPKEGADAVLEHYQKLREKLGDDHAEIRSQMMDWYRSLSNDDPRKAHKHYNWSDDRGLYFADNFAGPDDGRKSRPRHDIFHPVTGKSCKKPSTGWRWDEDKTNWALSQTPPRIHFGDDENTIPNRKSYLKEIATEPSSSVFYADGRSATLEVERLVGEGVFPFPKNKEVIADLIELICDDGDVVLDFFAGSATTGHSCFYLAEAGRKNVNFILAQLPEATDQESKARQLGYKDIASVGRERLRKVGGEGNTGFRSFKLSRSAFMRWDASSDMGQHDLLAEIEMHASNVQKDASDSDMLFELLLKDGFELTTKVDETPVAGGRVYSVADGALLICLEPNLTKEIIDALADLAETNNAARVVCLDAGFQGNDQLKANAVQTFKSRLGHGEDGSMFRTV